MKSIVIIALHILLLVITIQACGQESTKAYRNRDTAPGDFRTIEERQQQAQVTPVINSAARMPGFRKAAAMVLPGVVHVLAAYMPDVTKPSEPLTVIYDDAKWTNAGVGISGVILGSASGVVLTGDGLVLTCYHCVKGALRLEVVLQDRRVFKAKVLSADSASDLALLRIDAHDLQFVQLGNYDSLEVGDWVMAAGYPLNLASTVTVGIVSAKARYMGDIFAVNGVSTFIQTDAVVCEGSSGGPLLDIDGRLVGINSGIVTTTNLYAGYSFAVPVNVVSRICNDMLRYGKVRRAGIGADMHNLYDRRGVRLKALQAGGPAQKAGLLPGDTLTSVNGKEIVCVGWLEDELLLYHPGDTIRVGCRRKEQVVIFEIILTES